MTQRNDWRTPLDIVQRAKNVMGGIDFDPCASPHRKDWFAEKNWFEKGEDANLWPTICSVFLNPPGGKINRMGSQAWFWRELMRYRDMGRLEEAIFLGFNIEILQTAQSMGCDQPLDFRVCIPKKRIRFLHADGENKISPRHGNIIVYVPGDKDHSQEFMDEFEEIGWVG